MLEEPSSTYSMPMSFNRVDADRGLHRHNIVAFPSFLLTLESFHCRVMSFMLLCHRLLSPSL